LIRWFVLVSGVALFGCSDASGADDDSAEPPGDDDVVADDDATADDDTTAAPLPYNGCGAHREGVKAAGTWAEPIDAPYLPFFDRSDTTASTEDLVDFYDCAPTLGEAGTEVVYRFVTDHPGTFRAEVACVEPVDVDLHLLQAPVIEDGQAQGCIERAHIELEVEGLQPGEYWLVADSWSDEGGEYPGAYELAFEWIADDVWVDVEVRPGVTWSRLRSPDLQGGDQTVNVLRIDPGSGIDIQPHMHGGCRTVPDVAAELGAFAAVNAGFFASGCAPLDMIKADGTLYATNTCTGSAQRTLGWNGGGDLRFEWVGSGADWPDVANAVGAHPSLVTDGAVAVDPYDAGNSFYTSRHPRSAMGLTIAGELLLLTVDGRTSAGDGMTCDQTAQLLLDLGAVDAANLDGGGSTTMTVQDCWIGDVVNHPSDNGEPDHHGERAVSDGIYLR